MQAVHRFRLARFALLVSVLLLTSDIDATPAMQPGDLPETKRGPMNPHTQAPNAAPAMPLLDAAAPTAFETAAFGLG